MIDTKVYTFIQDHHVLNLCTCKDNEPYCASCFYAFEKEHFCFIFASNTKTKHIQNILENPNIAGNIHLETKEVGKIQGLQFQGICQEATKKEQAFYYKKYPFARALLTKLWSLRIKHIKFTDNRLGFGKKLQYDIDNNF